VERPVRDETALAGRFDVDLEWSTAASPDSPTVSIYTAPQEQPGLRLQPNRQVLPVLVIDSVSMPEPD
jgi:uncharacterized protein (TIGR03435 family)